MSTLSFCDTVPQAGDLGRCQLRREMCFASRSFSPSHKGKKHQLSVQDCLLRKRTLIAPGRHLFFLGGGGLFGRLGVCGACWWAFIGIHAIPSARTWKVPRKGVWERSEQEDTRSGSGFGRTVPTDRDTVSPLRILLGQTRPATASGRRCTSPSQSRHFDRSHSVMFKHFRDSSTSDSSEREKKE